VANTISFKSIKSINQFSQNIKVYLFSSRKIDEELRPYIRKMWSHKYELQKTIFSNPSDGVCF
jgi:hypothetical protein